MRSENRSRLIFLYQYLFEHTDMDHYVTTNQLIDLVKEELDQDVNRITISDDITALRDAGYGIEVIKSRQNRYYYDARLFDTAELKMLIDAISSSRFITEKKSKELINKLLSLTSEYERERLNRHVTVEGRVKSENEVGYYIVDAINEAIDKECKVRFLYTDYSINKRKIKTNDGKPYTVSPYALVWDGDYYYMIGFCDERNDMRHFRLDRIDKAPLICDDEPRVPEPRGFKLNEYLNQVFRMYTAEKNVRVELLCEDYTMKFLIDQFGTKVKTQIVGPTTFRATIDIYPSPTFFRWVFGFNGAMKIISPLNVKEEYQNMARNALEE